MNQQEFIEQEIELISKLSVIDATGSINGNPTLGMAGAEKALNLCLTFLKSKKQLSDEEIERIWLDDIGLKNTNYDDIIRFARAIIKEITE